MAVIGGILGFGFGAGAAGWALVRWAGFGLNSRFSPFDFHIEEADPFVAAFDDGIPYCWIATFIFTVALIGGAFGGKVRRSAPVWAIVAGAGYMLGEAALILLGKRIDYMNPANDWRLILSGWLSTFYYALAPGALALLMVKPRQADDP